MDGIGPIDPGLARDLAAAAARNPRSTWCVTVTDSQGHATGHGWARPAPRNGINRRRTEGLIHPAKPGSPSPRLTSPARRAGTGPNGGSPPGSPDNEIC
jgi:hypothetical protein